MPVCTAYVRFRGQSGHDFLRRKCPLMTQSGHCTFRTCGGGTQSLRISHDRQPDHVCISFTRCGADRPRWCGEVATTEPMVRRPVETTGASHCTRGRCSLLYKGSLFTIPTASSGLVCVIGASSCSGACSLAADFIANLCFDQAQRARISAAAILSGANSETARPAASESIWSLRSTM
jgi:hypothetical protein